MEVWHTIHKTIKIIPNTNVDFGNASNMKKTTFKVNDDVRISKYKNAFSKGCKPNSAKEIIVIKQLKNASLWTCGIEDFNGEETIITFYELTLQITEQN